MGFDKDFKLDVEEFVIFHYFAMIFQYFAWYMFTNEEISEDTKFYPAGFFFHLF
jgi:hypothetical protein